MEALANIARQNITAAPSNHAVPAPATAYGVPGVVPPTSLTSTPVQNQAAFPAVPPVNAPGMPFQYPQLSQPPAQPPVLPVSASAPPQGFPGVVAPGVAPAPAPQAAGMDPILQQQVMLIQLLASQGVPYDKIPALVASMQGTAGAAAAPAAPVPQPGQPPYTAAWGQDGYGHSDSHDRSEYSQVRSPNRYANRSRSRSPQRHWDSPRGRSERDYGSYRDSPGPGRGRTQDYRQRSPPGRRVRSPSPQNDYPQPPATKWVDYDRTIPSGHIKGMLTNSALNPPYTILTNDHNSPKQNSIRRRRDVS